MANLAVLTTLPQPGDLICLDKLNHASLIEAGRRSGAGCRIYPHGGLEKLERLLARHHNTAASAHRYVVTDTVFSMDGDVADLNALSALSCRYDATLVIDEAHATGVLGPHGAGLSDHLGITPQIDIAVSTASKALGGLGGIVTADRVVIDTLVNRASAFIFTTALPPAQVAALGAALDLVQKEPWRRKRLDAAAGRVTRVECAPYPSQAPVKPRGEGERGAWSARRVVSAASGQRGEAREGTQWRPG